MDRTAIVIYSNYGQTRKIAQRIKDILCDLGSEASVFDASSNPSTNADNFVIGVPVYAGKFDRTIVSWVKANVAALNSKPCAFFMVSMNAADKRPKARVEDARLVSEFLGQTGLKPKFVASFSGAVQYRKYGFLIRMVMKKICKEAGGPTDTSINHDLTEWGLVEEFGRAFGCNDADSGFAVGSAHDSGAREPSLTAV